MAVRANPTLGSQIRAFNQEALNQLRSNRIDEALVHLQRAGQLLHKIDNPVFPRTFTSKSATNTQKHTFRRGNSPQRYHSARKSGREKVKVAQSLLNECSVRSKQGDHISALHYAQEALQCLSCERPSSPVNVFIALAHYSVGVEWEYLKEKQGAREAYVRAVDVASRELGEKHEITQSLRDYCKKVTEKEGKLSNFDRSQGEKSLSPTKFRDLLMRTSQNHASKLKIKGKFAYVPILANRRRSGAATDRTHSAPKSKIVPIRSQSPLSRSQVLSSAPKTSTSFYETLRKSRQVPIHEDLLSPIYSLKTPIKRVNTESSAATSSSVELKARGAISELERLKKIVTEEHRLRLPPQIRVPKLPKRYLFTSKTHQLSPIPESASRTKLSPVVKIQAAVRRFLSQRKYQQLRKCAIGLQRRIRGLQVLMLYRNIRAAIIFIQRYWRKYLQKRLLAIH